MQFSCLCLLPVCVIGFVAISLFVLYKIYKWYLLRYVIIIIIIIIIIFVKSFENANYMQSIRVCIQHTYHKIITEELGAFVGKLSVVASCS